MSKKPSAKSLIESAMVVDRERQVRSLNVKINELKEKNKSLLTQLDLRESQLDLQAAMRTEPSASWKWKPIKRKGTATAGMLWSDWHVDEKVTLETTEGMNEWNPDVAEASIQKLVDNTIRLIEIERNMVQIDRAFLWLGGDFISGPIHEELEITNTMSPDGAISWLRPRLREGINRVRTVGKIKELLVVCSFGNHGRWTTKVQSKREWDVSREWWLYHDLSLEHKDRGIHWNVGKSYRTTVDIEGLRCGFEHGHKNKYGGGIGGPLIPVNRKLGQLNSAKETRSDMTFMGHFHTEGVLGPVVMNASLIGMAEYVAGRVAYAPPSQTLVVLDKGRMTLHRSVRVR